MCTHCKSPPSACLQICLYNALMSGLRAPEKDIISRLELPIKTHKPAGDDSWRSVWRAFGRFARFVARKRRLKYEQTGFTLMPLKSKVSDWEQVTVEGSPQQALFKANLELANWVRHLVVPRGLTAQFSLRGAIHLRRGRLAI